MPHGPGARKLVHNCRRNLGQQNSVFPDEKLHQAIVKPSRNPSGSPSGLPRAAEGNSCEGARSVLEHHSVDCEGRLMRRFVVRDGGY